MKKLNFTVDLVNDKILKSLIIFSIPILISNIFQQLYNMADFMIVGNFLGEKALAAMGVSAIVFELLVGFSLGVGNGMSMVVARNFGEQNQEKLKKSVAGSIVIGTFITIILVVISQFTLYPLLEILDTPQSIIEEAYKYIYIVATFIGVTFAYNLFSGILRAIGNSFMALVFLIIASILNIVLDIYFIKDLKMGISGAAIATVIAQAISVICCLVYIYYKEPILIPKKRHFKFDKKLYLELFTQGISMGSMWSIIVIGSLVLQYSINGFGELIIAGHVLARKIMGFTSMPIGMIAVALATFVSQNKGANKGKRIKDGVFIANALLVGYSVIITILTFLFAKNLVGLVSGSKEEIILNNGTKYLMISAPFYSVLGILINLRYSLQALGEKVVPLFSSGIEFIGKILFVIFLIPKLGYFGVMICEPVIWVIMCIQLWFAFYKNEYIKKIKK